MSTTFHFVPWLRPLAALSFLAASGCTTDPNVVGTLEETGDLTSTSADSGSTTGDTTATTTSTGPAPGSTTSPVDSVDGSEDGSEEATSTDGPAGTSGSVGASSEALEESEDSGNPIDDGTTATESGDPPRGPVPTLQWSATVGMPSPSMAICDVELMTGGRLSVATRGLWQLGDVPPGQNPFVEVSGIFTTELGEVATPSFTSNAPLLFPEIAFTSTGDVYALTLDFESGRPGVGLIDPMPPITLAGIERFQWYREGTATGAYPYYTCLTFEAAMVVDDGGDVLFYSNPHAETATVERIAVDGTVLETVTVPGDFATELFSEPLAAGPDGSFFVLGHTENYDDFVVQRHQGDVVTEAHFFGTAIGIWSNPRGSVDVLAAENGELSIVRLDAELSTVEVLDAPETFGYLLPSVGSLHVLTDGGYLLMTNSEDGYALERFDDQLVSQWWLPLGVPSHASLAVAPGPNDQIAVAWAEPDQAVQVQVFGD